MDSQSSVSSLAERLGSGSKREKFRDHHHNKDYRLSKADIGGPISTTDNTTEQCTTTESLGAPSMVLRCVVIHRDDKGYGLTVSGDNPVYVQSVKENGAAHTAGVRQGDRIVKVNGTNVTDSNHIEVVKLIKSGHYVALTLLGPPLTQSESSALPDPGNSGQQQSRPPSILLKDSFHDEKVNTIKKMLQHEQMEVERIKEEYAKSPNNKILEDLGTAQKLLQDLEKQLWKAESTRQAQDIPIQHINKEQMRVSSIDAPTGATGDMEEVGQPNVFEIDLNDTKVKKYRDQDATSTKEPGIINNEYTTQSSSHARQKLKEDVIQHSDIMNFEEDEFADPSEMPLDHGPFQDFDKIKSHPAYIAVFLNYVFRCHDPTALLLVLSVEQYRQISNMKELNKTSDLICKTYISPSAVLKFTGLDEGIARSIADALQSKNLSEEALRSVFDPAVQHALKTVKTQLEHFCVRRDQGLTHSYGEDKISKNMDHTQETKVVEEILAPLMQDLGQPQAGAEDGDINSSKNDALEKLLMHWTGKKKSRITSRMFGSMLRPKPVQMRPKPASSMESIIDDQNKRISILGRSFGKKKQVSGTVIPVVHSTQGEIQTDSGMVSQMIGRFQESVHVDGNKSASNIENSEVLDVPGSKKNKGIGRSGSFRGDKRHRSATGKSNSDPDAMAVESAISGNSESSLVPNSTSNSSLSSSQTSVSLSSTSSEDLMAPLIAANPELEVEQEYQWSQTTPREVIKDVDKKEIKRQEIISELLHTEKHHVRDLLILNLLFYNKMQTDGGLTREELLTVFPNLQEILSMHRQLKDALMDINLKDGYVVKDISHVLLDMFAGQGGEKFKNECAVYCGNQTAALEFIKDKCKKDQKFNSFIQATEKHPICRRLQLKDYVPIEFQRLTKYPLLLENIIKNTKKKEEASKLRQVQKQCKAILSYVNKTVKDAEDHQKIVEIQKNLDASSLNKVDHPIAREYKNINLTERKLVHQGPLTWRITQTEKKKVVVLHCVLFEDIMVLLQKQDEKYVLKCHTSTTLTASKDLKSTVQPPILKLSRIIVRSVATDKRAFFLVSTSEFGPQIYELVAMTTHETQEWLKIVQSTSESAKKNDTTSIVSAPIRRQGFMVPETSRSIESTGEKKEVLEKPSMPNNQVHAETVLDKIRKKHEEIFAALEYKHNLLATYAGIESSQLENVLDMSLQDSSPDADTVVLHLLTCTKRLISMLNEALSPDTVFLPPTAPPVLLPIPDSTDVSSSTPTQKSEDGKDDISTLTTTSTDPIEISWTENTSSADPLTEDDKDLMSGSSLEPLTNELTNNRLSNASLDLVASDYETASEPASPTIGDSLDNQIPAVEKTSIENIVNTVSTNISEFQNDDIMDEPSLPVTEKGEDKKSPTALCGADIGITGTEDLSQETNDTLSGAESLQTPKLVSPIEFGDNLLDFGSQAITPDASMPTSTCENASGVILSRTSSLDVTKMLGFTYQMESQLYKLLQTVKEMNQAKQELETANSNLITTTNESNLEQKDYALVSTANETLESNDADAVPTAKNSVVT